jgi:hypothetical protein
LQQSRSNQLFLDGLVYQDKSPVQSNASNHRWIGAETGCGIAFQVSLRAHPPPALSTLHIWIDDALRDDDDDAPISVVYFDGVRRRISVEAVASCRDVIVMHTGTDSGTLPRFRHDYYLLTDDCMLRLPPMPGPHEINLGILQWRPHEYTVAVLKEGGSSLAKDPTEAPYVCIYSTSTNEWSSRTVSVPACWSWDIDMVLADGTTFWWVDLHCGIVSYDMDQKHDQSSAVPGFIPLPPPLQPDRDEREYHLRQDRCVGVSAGELRCVHVSEDSVNAWSWRGGEWMQDYQMRLPDLWEKTGYSESGLPKVAPEYPSVDPWQPNLVNFFLPIGKRYDGYIVGLDLVSMEIMYRGQLQKGLLHTVTGLEIVELSGTRT